MVAERGRGSGGGEGEGVVVVGRGGAVLSIATDHRTSSENRC